LNTAEKGNPRMNKDEMGKVTDLKKIEFVDETFRDAPQSVWATRMRTESMIGIAPMLDEAGFQQACVSSAAAFETAVMYLYEDPWERIRLLKKSMPKTPLSVLIRGRNLFGWRMFSNDVIELLLKCLFKAGIQWIMVFDGLNDLRNLEWHIRAGKKIGLKAIGQAVFTESPVHTDEYLARKANWVPKASFWRMPAGCSDPREPGLWCQPFGKPLAIMSYNFIPTAVPDRARNVIWKP
jgi:pyruvate/oxaloacetate carboxyltransferase